MRLDKYLADCGAGSRSEIKKLIRGGDVRVFGIDKLKPDMQIDEKTAEVSLSGKKLIYRKFIYLMLNKPQGYVSAVYDKHYPVVTDLIDKKYAHFSPVPVGRLDIDTEGLLILTNDGAFNHNMTSPRKNIYKRYFARLDKPAVSSDIEVFKSGMVFKDFTAKPAVLEITENPNEVFIEIAEGKFHQVKRMCERVGKNVIFLKRVSIGKLFLDDALKPGESRELTQKELELLNS